MKQPFQQDPKWVEAKRRCQLNQDDIAKAKALGFTPKALLKNIPGPQQKWKQPVKFWIRDLYEEKFGAKSGARPPKPLSQKPRAAGKEQPAGVPPPFTVEPAGGPAWEDDRDPFADDDEFLPESVEDELPVIQVEHAAEFYCADDKDWHTHRVGRRQTNLRWAAVVLTIALKEQEAVDAIALFGSVAQPPPEGPEGTLWEDPPPCHECRDLDLVLWLTRCDDDVLRSLTRIVHDTLRALAATELLTLRPDQVDLHLLEAGTDRFLGRLRLRDAENAAPTLDGDPKFRFKPETIQELQTNPLFVREPPPGDAPAGGDIPF